MRDEAFKRIGHLYPPVEVTAAMAQDRPDLTPYVGQKLTVIAWLWARTVKSPNPAFAHIDVPLASTFILSSKSGKEAYVQPIIGPDGYTFTVRVGKPPAEAKNGTAAGKRAAFNCVMSKSPINYEYIRREAVDGRMNQKLMVIVAEGSRGRVYLDPTASQENTANNCTPGWKPEIEFFQQALGFRLGNYGMKKWSEIFTNRQLTTLSLLSDLVIEAQQHITKNAEILNFSSQGDHLNDGGRGLIAYAEAVCVYLGICVARYSNASSTVCSWNPGEKKEDIRFTFSRQALSMTWDFAEGNPFSDSSGNFSDNFETWVYKALLFLPSSEVVGLASQENASTQNVSLAKTVSTDPPYYDNIGYADLSDFFYIWLRKTLRQIFPGLLSTISVPKNDELVATPGRHGSTHKAEKFFLEGMTKAMNRLAFQVHPSSLVTIYYAFKQADTRNFEGTTSTGWETFLEAVNRAGLVVTGTWPIRTERSGRVRDTDSNALASSIVLVCQPRLKDAGTISRRQFVRQLNEALPLALDAMTRASEGKPSPVAPVDLSQAIIGPGMAIFSRYDAVLEADGTPMSVKTALQLINRFLAEDDFDGDTQFCLHWFEQHGWEPGKFGEADTLARAKGTSVEGVRSAGVIEAAGGIVRLLRWREYPAAWDPRLDTRLPVWEALHHLIRAHHAEGDTGAARVLAGVASRAEAARQLAYRLYTLCERAGRAEDARAYNDVVTGWTGIESAAAQVPGPRQGTLFGDDA